MSDAPASSSQPALRPKVERTTVNRRMKLIAFEIVCAEPPAAADLHGAGHRECRQAEQRRDGHAAEGCCNSGEKPRSHDTSRIAWAKLMARVGEDFPFACPGCGGDIRLIAFITDPGPIRKILTHLGEPLEPPPVSPARGPPTDWGELVQIHDDRNVFQATDRRAARDRYPQPLTPAERQFTTKPSAGRTRRDSAPTPEKRHFRGESRRSGRRF